MQRTKLIDDSLVVNDHRDNEKFIEFRELLRTENRGEDSMVNGISGTTDGILEKLLFEKLNYSMMDLTQKILRTIGKIKKGMFIYFVMNMDF